MEVLDLQAHDNMTKKETLEVLYQVYHRTGYKISPMNNYIDALTVALSIYDIDKDEFLDLCISTIHNISIKQKFNWLWD